MAGSDQRIAELENKEWFDALEDVYRTEGAQRVGNLIEQLQGRAARYGLRLERGVIPRAKSVVKPAPSDSEGRDLLS